MATVITRRIKEISMQSEKTDMPKPATKVNLLDFDREGLRRYFTEQLADKAFRAEQVMKWIYHFGCDDFDQMTNLNKALREKLKHVAFKAIV